jgi:hypothetical protein
MLEKTRYYVPKIVLNDESKYVFIGNLMKPLPVICNKLLTGESITKRDHEQLQIALGKKYKKILLLDKVDVVYKPEIIRQDDTINSLRKKVCIYLDINSVNKIYIWYNRKVKNDASVIYTFINNVFKKNSNIKYSEFASYVKNYFDIHLTNLDNMKYIDKVDALKLLFDSGASMVSESLCFQYSFDGYISYFAANPHQKDREDIDTSSFVISNTFSLLLSNFDIYNDIINIYTYKKNITSDIYFPFDVNVTITADEKKFINNVSILEKEIDEIEVPSNTNINNVINFLHIKGNDININSQIELEKLFNAFETSDSIPFIKYKTSSNVYYKIHKTSLVKISNDDIQKWTRISSTKDDRNFIVFKLMYNNKSYCSFSLNTDLSYNIKLNLSIKDNERIEKFISFIPKLNDLIEIISSIYEQSYIPKIPIKIIEDSRETDVVRVVQIITSSSMNVSDLNLNLNLNFKKLDTVIKTHMYPFFNIIDNKDKSILHLQYKKVNNYTKFSNISSFISFNYLLPREELIHQLISTFLISSVEAEKEIDSWMASNTMELEINKNKLYIKPRSETLINIKIRLNSNIDLRYMVNGITNMNISHDIDNLILKLLVLTERKKKVKVDVEKLEKMDSISDNLDNQDLTFVDIQLDDDIDAGVIMSDDEEDDDLKALQMEFESEIKALNVKSDDSKEVIVNSGPERVIKVKGYILNKLYDADRKLFKYEVPPERKRKDYASICGWTDRRQPVVVNMNELEKINKDHPDAINGYVKSGSTPELYKKHAYICPKVWCPKSRVALSDVEFKKLGNKCPNPNIEEDPIIFTSKSYFGEGEGGLKKERYPGFLDTHTHPDRICLPCCFKVKPEEGNRNNERSERCVVHDGEDRQTENDENIDDDVSNKEKYIKGANYTPIESGRYGLIPQRLVDFLKQSEKQGNRHDGTGSMTDKTDCILRKGINQTGQSYLDAIVSILNNPNITTSKQLISIILENIDVLTYISLENGRIMKMFIDTSKTVFDESNFKEFYNWFKNQKKYIISMNMERLLVEIESIGTYDSDSMHHHQDILREYIIYQSFKNFKDYLSNDRISKEHLVLSDLITNYMTKLVNIHKYNIVVLDYNSLTDKIYIQCNVNRIKSFDKNNPFVFLLKRYTYYEPFVHLKYINSVLKVNSDFTLKDSTDAMKQLIEFVVNNCNRSQTITQNLIMYLKGIGFKPKYYVIDYGYKSCGIILNNNIYIPLEDRTDLYYEESIKYVYISDVPNFKCLMDKAKVKELYSKVRQFTKSNLYKIESFIVEDGKTIGFTIKDDYFVPLKVSKKNSKRLGYHNGLFVLIGHEETDKRQSILNMFKKEYDELETLSKKINDHIRTDDKMKVELNFLLDQNNPLPLVYKKKRLYDLLNSKIPNINASLYKLLEYLKDGKHFRMYKHRTRRFKYTENELMFDHFDIQNGRLQEAIDFAENPHKSFLTNLSELNENYIFEEEKLDLFDDIIKTSKLEDVPVKWRKVLLNYKVIENNDDYNPKYIYNIFQRISKQMNGEMFSDDLYKVTYQHRIIEGYKKQMLPEILDNPWLENHFKKTKTSTTVNNILDQYESIYYYPSTFDIKMMAALTGINLILIGRKTMKNPDGLEVIYNNSNFYVILLFFYDRYKVVDKFSFFTYDNKIYFRNEDLPNEFLEIISKKIKTYEIDITD